MAGRITSLLLLTAWFAGSGLAAAQPAGQTLGPPAQTETVAHFTLGRSVFPLNGPWRFTVGDSPIDAKTGKPLWAEPDFDDSRWETVDLTPKDGAVDPISGTSGYVPGWTAKGHPGYWGYAWYRIRVQVRAWPGEALALAGPSDLDDAYQLFDDGILVGHFGDFAGGEPKVYYTRPKMFPLSQPAHGGAQTGQNETAPEDSTRVLAFRLWMEPFSVLYAPDAGGLHTAPVLGEAGAVAAGYQMRWLELIRAHASDAAEALLFCLLAVIAFTLILFDRADRVYLWMGALFLLVAVDHTLYAIGSWTDLQSIPISNLLLDGLTVPLIYAAFIMVWRVWFRQQRPAWLPRLTAALAVLVSASFILGEEVFFGLVPHAVAIHCLTASVVLRLLLFALIVWVVVEGIRHQGVEGWLVLPVVLLRAVGSFSFELQFFHIKMFWYPFGVVFDLGQIADLLVAFIIALLLLRRLLKSVKRQRQVALDVKQAQEVQQVILPEAHVVLPGFTIESEYRPALEVGGDFFQIVPHASDGSLLIVAGDVAGKGLRAGMLVALLVGGIRSTAETNAEPLNLLAALNRRLVGRADAQATCLALRIEKDGAVTLANAGHMAPYLNGEPVEMEGALPLGMIKDAEFSVMRFKMKDGDRLVMLSDGIVEATDANGNLLGFERVRELLHRTSSAAEIAGSAQQFGQQDDISVISVTRVAVPQPALA
jgi:hypothetical protein